MSTAPLPPEIPDILARLIGFQTLSRQSNLALLDYVEGLLRPHGIRCERFASADETRANLWASTGPDVAGGVVLSGHCDVVPVAGQDWSRDPFVLHLADGRYYGRGTADMKGFLAVALHALCAAAARPLKLPLHLAISYDEEIGCMGVRGMLDALGARPGPRPALCIVGEPTGMRVATGHKGKRALRACAHGQAGHSALAPDALNALHLGAAFVAALQRRQDWLQAHGARDPAYDIPHTTLHVGMMQGGTALNIVPDLCEMEFEIRNVVGDDPDALIADLVADADCIAAPHRNRFPQARIEIVEVSGYPGLETAPDLPAVALIRSLLGQDEPTIKVSFGTEAGLFQERLGLTTLVCGPGDMAQGHKADEFVSMEQLRACHAFLGAVVQALEDAQSPALGA